MQDTEADRTGGLSLREAAGQAVLLAALLAAAFPGVFFRGEMISPADIAFQQPPWASYAPADWEGPSNPLMADALTLFRPWYTTTRASVRSGAWPLWNPYEFAGIPLLANYQSAVFYPPRLLHVFLDVDLATTLCILLKLWLAGMAAYLCARTLRLLRPAAVFCSVGWMFSGYNLLWCNWSLPDLSPWLAVLVLGSELLFQRQYQRGFFAVALGATLLLLAGHPVSAFTMSLGLGVYFVVRLSLEARRGQALRAPLGAWMGAWSLAFLVCAALLLPFFEYLGNQYQGQDLAAFGAERGLPLSASAAFWVPRFFGTAAEGNYWGELDSNRYSMIYPGVAVWLCAALALYARRGRRQSGAAALALAAAAGFGIALAFEAYPFSLLHGLPFFDTIKRSYHVCFAVFALPLLGAIGLDTWLRETRRSLLLSPILLALAACGLVALVWQFYGALIRMRELTAYLTLQTSLAAAFAVLGLALLASGVRFQRKMLFGYALAALLAIDLLLAHRGLNPTIDRRHLMPETALTQYVQQHRLAKRVGTAEGGVPGGLMAAYGIEEWLGEDGMYPERMLRFLKALGPELWEAMEPACAIDCYLKHPAFTAAFPENAIQRLQYLDTLDGLEVYANKAAFPRAYLASGVQVCRDRETMYALMADPEFDPIQTALLEAPLAASLPGAVQGTATVVNHGFTEVAVETETDGAALLILADAYYPGWTATVNGTPAAIVPVYSVFRGVAVPEGRAEVRFTYFPAAFRAGLACSVLALSAGSGAGLFLLRRSRRRAR